MNGGRKDGKAWRFSSWLEQGRFNSQDADRKLETSRYQARLMGARREPALGWGMDDTPRT